MKPSEVKMKRNDSLTRRPARTTAQAFFTKRTSIALLLALCSAPISLPAASPPPATLMYTDPAGASIHGGVATIGPTNTIYFSILSTPTNSAKILKLAGNTVVWTFNAPGVGTNYDMYAIPALDAACAKLYICSDYGLCYCLDRSFTPANRVVWQFPPEGEPPLTDKIRSGAALDPNNPLGPTVYFHCNNGYLYALDANTGAQRWNAHTANEGGPPTAPDSQAPGGDWNPHPVSSSPVVDSSGVVYVGSADGSVYSFNP